MGYGWQECGHSKTGVKLKTLLGSIHASDAVMRPAKVENLFTILKLVSFYGATYDLFSYQNCPIGHESDTPALKLLQSAISIIL